MNPKNSQNCEIQARSIIKIPKSYLGFAKMVSKNKMGDAQKVFMVEGFGLSAKTTGFESVVSVEWKMGKEERDRNFFKKREEKGTVK